MCYVYIWVKERWNKWRKWNEWNRVIDGTSETGLLISVRPDIAGIRMWTRHQDV